MSNDQISGKTDLSKDRNFSFIGRADQLKHFCDFVTDPKVNTTRRIIVRGDSGTGKSYFVKEAIYRILVNLEFSPTAFYVDLSNDEFQSARLIESLLNLSLVPWTPTRDYPLSIIEGLTVKDFQKNITQRKSLGWNFIKGLSQAAGNLMGVGGAVNTVLKNTGEQSQHPKDVFTEYLSWITQKSELFLVIDNFQFVNYEVRFLLESVLKKLGSKAVFVLIDRTINGVSEISPPLQTLFGRELKLQIDRFTEDETEKLIQSMIALDKNKIKVLSKDVFTKTNGLAKDIEYCLKAYQLDRENYTGMSDVLGLLTTIHKLPLMHRQFLLIATMLDGGVHSDIARRVIKRAANFVDDAELEKALSQLILLEYLKINSDTGTRIRAGHERIIQAMKELTSDDQFNDIRSFLIEEFSSWLVKQGTTKENETYILHCMVGLQTAMELQHNLHFVSRLIRRQYRAEQFAYLVNLAGEAKEILPMLAEDSVALLLDAMQKSSAFDRGLLMLQHLQYKNGNDKDEFLLFKYKFLIQLYNYSGASKIAEQLPPSAWADIYRVNVLLALENEKEAIKLIEKRISSGSNSESTAVLNRNAVTLYTPEKALLKLKDAEAYFKNLDSDFGVATVITNRGLIFLCQRKFSEASKELNKAISMMQSIGSREVFQAQFNLGLTQGLRGNYRLAMKYLLSAEQIVPDSLLLDKTKIEVATTILNLVFGKTIENQAINQLKDALLKIRGVELPYLRKTINHNISVLSEGKYFLEPTFEAQFASQVNTSLYIPVEGKYNYPLLVNPSVHWRY